MSRKTVAHQLQEANEEQAREFFERTLANLPDPRRRQGMRYPLRTVIVIALMAMVCGCDDAEAFEAWGEANQKWLSTFLELPHGTPTQDVFLWVLASLKPDSLREVLRSWAVWLALKLGKTENCGHVALDGKTSRGSADKANGKNAIHTVTAFLVGQGLVLSQKKVDAKSNEITAIPEVLRTLNLRGTTITIDAMGCQTEIAKTIIEGEGDYILGLKDNQPTLHADVALTFACLPATHEVSTVQSEQDANTFETVEKGHGRLEIRKVELTRDLSKITTKERWPGLSFLTKVTRQRTILSTGKESEEISYYIGSSPTETAESAGTKIRRHWSIENELHWVLDMAFREDEARHRAGFAAENMSILRHFAINMVKSDKTRKLGVSNTRKIAGWDRNALLRILAGANGLF